MKTVLKKMWIVADPQGNPRVHTLEYTKRDSVITFMSRNGDSEWKDWEAGGWTVNKVDVEFKPL